MDTPHSNDNDLEETDNKVELATHRIRRELALIVTGLIVIISLIAVFQDGAMSVLDKVLPLVTLAFGFFFGQRVAKL